MAFYFEETLLVCLQIWWGETQLRK